MLFIINNKTTILKIICDYGAVERLLLFFTMKYFALLSAPLELDGFSLDGPRLQAEQVTGVKVMNPGLQPSATKSESQNSLSDTQGPCH